jgi:hypothetical protein
MACFPHDKYYKSGELEQVTDFVKSMCHFYLRMGIKRGITYSLKPEYERALKEKAQQTARWNVVPMNPVLQPMDFVKV